MARLFARACSDKTRGNRFILKEGIFKLHIRKKFFMTRVVGHWNMLPREFADAPSLEVFKVRLDGDFEQPHLMKDVPALGWGSGPR